MEWSCPLCTLLNDVKDAKCAACEHERPASVIEAKTVPGASVLSDKSDSSASFTSASTSSHRQSTISSAKLEKPSRLRLRSLPEDDRSHHRSGQDPPTWNLLGRNIHSDAKNAKGTSTGSTSSMKKQEEPKSVVEVDMSSAPNFRLLGINFPLPSVTPPSSIQTNTDHTYKHSCQTPGTSNNRIDENDDDDVVEPVDKMTAMGLDLNESEEENDTRQHRQRIQRNKSSSKERKGWICATCMGQNAFELAACRFCQSPKMKEDDVQDVLDTNPNESTWECSVCTNYNDGSLKSCEVCETERGDDDIAMTSHSEDQYLDTSEERQRPDPELIEIFESQRDADLDSSTGDQDISLLGSSEEDDIVDDGPMEVFSPRKQTPRPELRDFKHFICVENLPTADPNCKIDYCTMFGEKKSKKSYADRLRKRQQESRQRKDGVSTSGTSARASVSKAKGKVKKTTKTRKPKGTKQTRPGKRRAKSQASPSTVGFQSARTAIKQSESMNRYAMDDVELDGSISTMAWEGLGSAGFL